MDEESSVNANRRVFLKAAAFAGAATAAGIGTVIEAAGATTSAARPTGMTFATLRKKNVLSLGLKTDRGVFDVAAAEARFRENAPTTIDAVFKGTGDINGIGRLVKKAKARADSERFFIPL